MKKRADDLLRFGEAFFTANQMPLVRRLAAGECVDQPPQRDGWVIGVDRDLRALESLMSDGFVTLCRQPQGPGHYAASEKLMEQARIQAARPVLTFDQLAAKMGRSISPAKVRARQRRSSRTQLVPRKFPAGWEVQQAVRASKAAGLKEHERTFTYNAPAMEGDVVQFSSLELTDWYVQEFCTLNHLKG
jgi:hypothetical protein